MKNLGQITNNKDIATKEYVDNAIDGLNTILLEVELADNSIVRYNLYGEQVQ